MAPAGGHPEQAIRRIGDEALEAKAVRVRNRACQLGCGSRGGDASATEPRVAVNEDVEGQRACGPRQLWQKAGVVDADGHPCPLGQRCEPRQL